MRHPFAMVASSGLIVVSLAACQGAPAPLPEVRAPGEAAAEDDSGRGYTITRRYTAHHVLVVELETREPARAVEFARTLVEPSKTFYYEALVYVRRQGQPKDALAARRVQWTEKAGYVESNYER